MGEENKGFPYIMQHFALERFIMGINAHARSEFALEYTIQYMKDRFAFGKSISNFKLCVTELHRLQVKLKFVKRLIMLLQNV